MSAILGTILNGAAQIGTNAVLQQQADAAAQRDFLRDSFSNPRDVFAQYRDTSTSNILIYAVFGLAAIVLLIIAFSGRKSKNKNE